MIHGDHGHLGGANMGGQALGLALMMMASSAQTASLVFDAKSESMLLSNELAFSRVPNPNLPGMAQNLKSEIDKMQSMKPFAKSIQDYLNMLKWQILCIIFSVYLIGIPFLICVCISMGKKKKAMFENVEQWYSEVSIIIQNNQQDFLNNGVKLDLVKQQFVRNYYIPPKVVFTIQGGGPQQQMGGMFGMMPQMPQFGSQMPQLNFGQQPNAFQPISINEPSNGQQYKMPSQNQLFQFK